MDEIPGTKERVETKTQSTITLDSKDDKPYNPFEHRNLTHPTSTTGSFFHLLKSSLGIGLFAMPAAFKNTGIIPGCIGTVLVAVIATHCVHILVWTSREVCRDKRLPLLSYTDTCETVFKIGPEPIRRYSKFVRYFADASMAGVCLGGTAVYVILVAESIRNICDEFVPSHNLSIQTYCWIILLPLILTNQIRYLKFLVPFSMVANLCLVVTFVITVYYIINEEPGQGKVELAATVVNWPLFLSTAIFAMEGINVVMPVENEMAKPQHFLGCPGVLSVTMIFVSVLYGVGGLAGYIKYGDKVKDSITYNLPQGEPLALAAKILLTVAVFFTYCLQMYAPLDIMWTRLRDRVSKNYHNVTQIALRTVSVSFTVILAVAIPNLGLLLNLVGAIFFSTLGILMPLVIQTVYIWDKDRGRFNYILWKNGLLLIFYFIVLLSGCCSAITGIIEKYHNKNTT